MLMPRDRPRTPLDRLFFTPADMKVMVELLCNVMALRLLDLMHGNPRDGGSASIMVSISRRAFCLFESVSKTHAPPNPSCIPCQNRDSARFDVLMPNCRDLRQSKV